MKDSVPISEFYRGPSVLEGLVVGGLLVAFLFLFFGSLFWILKDAARRGKDKATVGMRAFAFWPLYHLVWLLIRPEIQIEKDFDRRLEESEEPTRFSPSFDIPDTKSSNK